MGKDMSTDRELLELAAKAAGVPMRYDERDADGFRPGPWARMENGIRRKWNPLTDDAAALRLAVKLRIIVTFSGASGRHQVIACQRLGPDSIEDEGSDPCAATRRAIVRAAAAIGKSMPNKEGE